MNYNFEAPIYVSPFEKHHYYKSRILDLIDHQNCTETDDGRSTIKRTDFFSDVGAPRQYFQLIINDLGDHLEKSMRGFSFFHEYGGKIINHWFQQYQKNNFHGYHFHPNCVWVGVYYVEISENAPGTTLLNVLNNSTFTPEVKEGDILVFPSFIKHASLPNQSNTRKTVISFNF